MIDNLVHADGDEEIQASSMSIMDHLDELRKRLVHTAIAVVVAAGISFVFIDYVMGWLLALVPKSVEIVTLQPTERFVVYMKVLMYMGAAIAMPIIMYEMIAFIAPGLRKKEKRFVYLGLPFVTLCFAGGIAFGYFLVLPRALGWLLTVGSPDIHQQVQLSELLSFTITFIFWLGVVFEMPVVIFFLSKIRILNVKRLNKWRKYAYLAILIVAAAITPTPDPFNQLIVAA
ncbi:MAG: twin-arginine translocase subunit TatC, partial [Chloroflexi bacterium]|nr:twin-arginine translocase subunit TatC [Chloroflexota bacterium]